MENRQEQLLETTRNRRDVNIFLHRMGQITSGDAEAQGGNPDTKGKIGIGARGREYCWPAVDSPAHPGTRRVEHQAPRLVVVPRRGW